MLVAGWQGGSAGLEVVWWVDVGLQEVLLDIEGVVEIVVWYCSCLYYWVPCFSVRLKIQWVLQGLVQCGHASG